MFVGSWHYNMSYFNQRANASPFSSSEVSYVNTTDCSCSLYSGQGSAKPFPTASAMIPTSNDVSFVHNDTAGYVGHTGHAGHGQLNEQLHGNDRVFSSNNSHNGYNVHTDDSYYYAAYGNGVDDHSRQLSPGPAPPYCYRYDENGDLKPRKRRLPSVSQRRAANVRERRRMLNLNQAFDALRRRIPTFAYEKRLSRIETLRLAIEYITFMTEIIKGKDPCDVALKMYSSMELDTSIPSLSDRLCNFHCSALMEGQERCAVTTGSGRSSENEKYSPVSDNEVDYDK
ncbi:uncharacterized protein LOC121380773 [Gigantopelta aegis]|uniref:uncharacterized protein LOC121380773 n=1 Tax=Gigantopelta aegis TaxID=1735272 RepID=UPI001B88CB14|nr:uncharacterized protein LOC121380773 [Gigantopelta aegis]